MRSQLRGFATVLLLVLRDQPLRAIGTALFTVVAQVSGPLIAFSLKLVTDQVVAADVSAATRAGAVLGALLGIWSLSGWASFTLRMRFREQSALVIDGEVARLSGSIHTLAHHERPDFLDRMTLLRQQSQRLAAVPDAVVINVGYVLRFVATVALLSRVHPALMLLPIAGVPSIVLGIFIERYSNRVQEEMISSYRLEAYLTRVVRDADAGKEIRVFGLADEILKRFDHLEAAIEHRMRRYTATQAATTAIGWLSFGIGFIVALIFVAHRAVEGTATPGDVVLALTLAAQVNGEVRGLVQLAGWLVNCAKTAGHYEWLAGYEREQHGIAHPAEPLEVPSVLSDGISLREVTFRYPGTEVDVLKDVNLHLPAGATIAIVGDNGAGKTTLVKLLCRFYDPTAGSITVDGTDLRRLDVDAWRRGLAGGFQDFCKFELAAFETVGVGDLPQLLNREAVQAALARANASDIGDALPAGLTTQLGRSFDDGVELSGGEWQKLALARAMMRDHPTVLILDEPTSALDAQTEHALFQRFADAATRTSGITVFVSHRFSTVRMADLIVVVEDGRVTEVGGHRELMDRAGTYAHLYELQARAYR